MPFFRSISWAVRATVVAAAFAGMVGPRSPLGAQVRPAPAPTTVQLDSVARRIVAAATYATFVTVDRAGWPQARTVQPVPPDAGWAIWFATNPRTRKVQEIRHNPRVVVHYFDPASRSYVAVTGRARLVRDRPTVDAHWDPAWSAYYPDRDSSVVLVAITPYRVEVVSPAAGIESDARTWRPQSFVPRRRP